MGLSADVEADAKLAQEFYALYSLNVETSSVDHFEFDRAQSKTLIFH